ncbi:MAG: DNA-protecting protein DprA [Acidimicrobiales bacterium]|nr:DNA-protecting protein DprA [Acidimicrobiales bacterium]
MKALCGVEAHAAALAGLPVMTPVRLSKLLDGFKPEMAWSAVRAGTHPADPRRRFAYEARKTDVPEVGERYTRAGVRVLLPDAADYPSMLVGDPGAPAVLFALGDPTAPEGRPRVAIVGTRSATHYGRQVASDLASELAGAGVVVVSGLARGIDGAAHAGVVRGAADVGAPPVAVVGTGLDVVYPSSNGELWSEVADRGVIFSESPLGRQPRPGVFPARNRIIAALSDVVVVVESHYGGGSLYTAEAAARRSIPVCAVPGSVHSRASEGTNALLVDGCVPVRDATDVLVAISLARAGRESEVGPGSSSAPGARTSRSTPNHPTRSTTGGRRPQASAEAAMDAPQRAVWEAVDDTPTAFETILIRTDLTIPAAAEACEHLVEQGQLVAGAGWWSKS